MVVGRFAVRTTSPFSFSTKPVASTMRSGVVVVILLATNERSRLSLLGLRVIKPTYTASVLRASPGLGGKPPRPVIINWLLAAVPHA